MTQTKNPENRRERKPLPSNLLGVIEDAKLNPERQMELLPPNDLSAKDAIVKRRIGTDEYPAWIGYPFQRAGKGERKVMSDTGKMVTVPHNYYEKCLTLRFSDGEKTFTAVAFDESAKCAVYFMDEVYEIPENHPVIVIEAAPTTPTEPIGGFI